MKRTILITTSFLLCFLNAEALSADTDSMQPRPVVAIANIDIGGLEEDHALRTEAFLRSLVWATLRGQGVDVSEFYAPGTPGPDPAYRIDVNYYEFVDSFVADLSMTDSGSGALIGTEIGQGSIAEVISEVERMSIELARSLSDVASADVSIAFGSFDYSRRGGLITRIRRSKVGGNISQDICDLGDLSIAIHRVMKDIEGLEVLEPSTEEIDCKARIPVQQVLSDRAADLAVAGSIIEDNQGVNTSISIVSSDHSGSLTIDRLLVEPGEYDDFRQRFALRVKTYVAGILKAWNEHDAVFGSFDGAGADELIELGTRYWNEGNTGLAVAYFQEAVTRDANSAVAHNSLAKLYYELSDVFSSEDMLRAARRAQDLDPGNLDYGWDVANALTLLGRFDDALAQIDRLDVPDAGNEWRASLAFNRAQLYVFLGDYDSAKKEYEAAFAIDELRIDAVTALVDLYAVEGSYDEAISTLQTALEIHPDNADLKYKLGEYHYERAGEHDLAGDYDAAISDYQASLYYDPVNVDALLDIVYIQFEYKNDFEAAYTAASDAIELELQMDGFATDSVLSNAAEPALATGRIDIATQYATSVLERSDNLDVRAAMHLVLTVAAMIQGDSGRIHAAMDELFVLAERMEAEQFTQGWGWAYAGMTAFIKSSELRWPDQEFLLSIVQYFEGKIEYAELSARKATWQEMA